MSGSKRTHLLDVGLDGWGEVSEGCSDMPVARATVWRMGRRCAVV
jgi:hypothetical protein